MALYTRKEFYEKCGIQKAHLNVYIQRGKVILSSEGLIDDTIEKNRIFYERQLIKLQVNGIPVKKTVTEEKPEAEKRTDNFNSKIVFELEQKLKQAELEKKEVDTRIALLKEEKLRGIVIPTDIVTMLFAQHFKSMSVEFNQGADNLITEFSKMAELNITQISELRGKLIAIVNDAIHRGIEESKKSVKNIVAEYSEKKGVGEKS